MSTKVDLTSLERTFYGTLAGFKVKGFYHGGHGVNLYA